MIKKKQAAKAFTLIEVLIVVLILGILATFAIPSFEGAQIKAKFSRALAITNRIEKEAELIILEEGWQGMGAAATAKLNKVLEDEAGLVLEGIVYVDTDNDFAYRITSIINIYAAVFIYTQQPAQQILCVRYYFKPGTALANALGIKTWFAYISNPYYKYIRGVLKGPVRET